MSSSFNHNYTPPELQHINAELTLLLANEASEEYTIQKIIEQRANLVETLLNTLDEPQKRCFATFEIKSNDAILAIVEERKLALKSQLGSVSKSSKAIKKYHQV